MTSEKEDELIKIAHEAVSEHSDNVKAATFIRKACEQKYG